MKKIIFGIRLTLFVWLFKFLVNFIPDEAKKTWQWISLMPLEKYETQLQRRFPFNESKSTRIVKL